LGHYTKNDWPALGFRIAFKNLAGFHKSQVAIKLVLKGELMGFCFGPFKMIRNRQDDVAVGTDTDYINNVGVIDCHGIYASNSAIFDT